MRLLPLTILALKACGWAAGGQTPADAARPSPIEDEAGGGAEQNAARPSRRCAARTTQPPGAALQALLHPPPRHAAQSATQSAVQHASPSPALRRRRVDESIMGAERFAALADKFSGTRTGILSDAMSDALRVYYRLGDEAIGGGFLGTGHEEEGVLLRAIGIQNCAYQQILVDNIAQTGANTAARNPNSPPSSCG